MNCSILLAEKYSALSYEQLTPQAIQKAKECIIDYLGCVYAGLPFDTSKIVRRFALQAYAGGGSTIIGSKEKLVAVGACMVNATTGHVCELDDVHKEAILHAGVIVIPVALALGEEFPTSGKSILAAIAAGYEVSVKVGRSSNPSFQLDRGFHPTSTCGVFGAAMAASHVMGLDTEKTANALGIAGSYSSGSLECYSDGSLTKPLNPGIAASSGTAAATLAGMGYIGPKGIFEGPRGFFRAYSHECNVEDLLTDRPYEIENISLKAHACCGFNQSPIDAILEIMSDEMLEHKMIESIIIELSGPAYNVVGQPAEIKCNPKNSTDAKFSAPYSVAVACIEGKAFLDEYSEKCIQRPDLKKLLGKISVKHSKDLDRFLPEAFPARLKVKTYGGDEFVKEVRHDKGDPENPLSWKEVLQKFNALVPSRILSQKNKESLMEAVEGIEYLKDIRELTRLV